LCLLCGRPNEKKKQQFQRFLLDPGHRDLYSLIQIFVQAILSRWNNIRSLFTLVKIE